MSVTEAGMLTVVSRLPCRHWAFRVSTVFGMVTEVAFFTLLLSASAVTVHVCSFAESLTVSGIFTSARSEPTKATW